MVDKRESITAKLCAFVRAWHSNRSRDKIYDDYLAYDMMGKDEYDEIYSIIKHGFSDDGTEYSDEDTEEIIRQYIASIPLSRIHFSESRLKRFSEENKKIQYVICGAGSDTFSFRMIILILKYMKLTIRIHSVTSLKKYNPLNGISLIMCILFL